jgi:hypothetical protein
MRVQSAARSSPFSRAIRRGGMRGGRAGCHQPGCRIRYVRATPLASIPYSPCQTAQFFSFPRRVVVRGFVSFRFASHLPPELRGRRSAGGGSLACPSRLRGATPCLPGDGRAPLGAPGGDFRPRDRRFIFRQCPPESAPQLRPRPGIHARPIGSAPPTAAVRSAALGRHSPAPPSGRHR